MTNDFEREDALNQQLQQLVAQVKQYPASSNHARERARRRIAMNKLVNGIQNSGKLSKQTQWSSLPNYEDYYNEALQKTLMEICQKVDQYDSKYPVMAWVNQIFKWRFHDVVNKNRQVGITKLPKGGEVFRVLSLDELNQELPTDNDISESEQVREVVEKDPENLLIGEHIKGHPQANLQAIILLILEGKKWKEISEDLNVPMTTAASFYQRRMHKIITYLKKYI